MGRRRGGRRRGEAVEEEGGVGGGAWQGGGVDATPKEGEWSEEAASVRRGRRVGWPKVLLLFGRGSDDVGGWRAATWEEERERGST